MEKFKFHYNTITPLLKETLFELMKEPLFALHEKRHEWEHNSDQLLQMVTDFSIANEMPDPICLLGKDWDYIKLDLIEAAAGENSPTSNSPI